MPSHSSQSRPVAAAIGKHASMSYALLSSSCLNSAATIELMCGGARSPYSAVTLVRAKDISFRLVLASKAG